MTTRIRSFVVLITAVLLQATIFSEFRLSGTSVEVLLLVTILAGYHGGPEHGAIFGFFASLFQDALTGAPFGLHAMVYSPLAVGVSSIEDSAKFQVISTFLKLLPLFFIIFLGTTNISLENIPEFNPTELHPFAVLATTTTKTKEIGRAHV